MKSITKKYKRRRNIKKRTRPIKEEEEFINKKAVLLALR